MTTDNVKPPLVVANWKMNCLCEGGKELASKIMLGKNRLNNIVICPPFTAIHTIASVFRDTSLKFGGQDCHYESTGAFTGEISASMLKDVGCDYVILGHSERRKHCGETDSIVNKKSVSALSAGLTSIICVGESLEERNCGKTLDVIGKQVRDSIPVNALQDNMVVAYEPVWAIGTGKVPTLHQIEEVHGFIISLVSEIFPSFKNVDVVVLYGGSVKPDNAENVFNIKGVGGVLVGGASLDAKSFLEIVDASERINT